MELVRNDYVWICFEGRGTNQGGALYVRFEKHGGGDWQISEYATG